MTNRIELPAHAYEAFLDLQNRLLTAEIDQGTAFDEMAAILSPYWSHQPNPWEQTEIVLKQVPMSHIILPK